MRDFRNIKAWQKAHQLVLAVYQATQQNSFIDLGNSQKMLCCKVIQSPYAKA